MRAWISRGGRAPELVVINSQAALEELLRARQASLLQIEPSFTWRPAPAAFPIELFCQELLALLRAGLSIVESIEGLVEEGGHYGPLADVLSSLRQGLRFSEALKKQASFPPLFVALVGASERTSDVPTALEKYAEYAAQVTKVQHSIRSALLYPALLLCVGLAVLAFLGLYVVPRFSLVYEGIRHDLPISAQLMLQWGQFVRSSWPMIVLALASLVALTVIVWSRRSLFRPLARHLLRLPVVGPTVRIFQLARLYRTFGMLLTGGMPFLTAARMSTPVLPESLRLQLSQLERLVQEGRRPSESLAAAQLTTAISLRMLSAGERTGELGSMMTRVADFYEAMLQRQLEHAMRIVEPTVMTVVGIGVGLVVVLMYLPIFELASAIQ